MQILGGSYLIVAEIPVQWLQSASQKTRTTTPVVHPVWLMDSMGIRAAIYMRCPACNKSINLFPSSATEQKEWNSEEPYVNTMLGCSNCEGLFMLTTDTAYALSLLPPQPDGSTVPRPWRGVANGPQGMA